MIIRIMGFENPIDFKEDYVNVLEISNVQQFSSFVLKFDKALHDMEYTELVLLDQNIRLDFSKNTLMVMDVLSINYNDKKIVNEAYNLMNNEVMQDNSLNNDYQKLVNDVYNYLLRFTTNLTFDTYISNDVKINDLLKVFSFKIDNEYAESILEKILLLIDIIVALKPNMLLIFVNLKCFLTQAELMELYKYVLYKNQKILLVENKKQELLQYENKNVLEADYYDYVEVYKI